MESRPRLIKTDKLFKMISKKQLSIKKEVFYLGLLSSIITLLVFGFLFSISLLNKSIETAKRSIMETNIQISIFTEGYFSELTNTIEALAENQYIRNAITADETVKERVLTTYKDFSNANKNITYLYSGYKNGSLLINDYTPPEGYDTTKRPWYIAAMDKKPETSIGLPYQEANTREWLISQSKVLVDSQGNHSGVIAIDCSLESIISLIGEKHLYDSQRSYIMDREGMILIHSKEELLGQTLPEIKNSITEMQGELTYIVDNKKIWAYYNTIDSTDWIIITAVDRWEIIRPIVLQILLYSFSVMLLAISLGTIQSKIFGKRFAEPLIELGKRIAAITEGKPRDDTTYKYSNHEIAMIAANIEKLAEHSLNKKANELKTIIESSDDGILVISDDRKITYVNSRFREMWDLTQNVTASGDEQILLDAIIDQLVEPDTFLAKIQELYASDKNDMDILYFKDGRVFERYSCPLIDEDQVVGRLWSFRDITKRKQAEEKLNILANTDDLTGLWNRRFFIHAIVQEIERAKRYNQYFSLMILDIDRFKKVNDTYGHAAGDAVLQHLSSTLKNSLRQVDIPGRIGGEEFGILVPDTDLDNAFLLAERLRQVIEKSPAHFQGREIYYTVSIGITTYNVLPFSVDELLKIADEALYEAKAKGRNCTVKKQIQEPMP